MKRLFIIFLILFFSASYGIAGPMIISGTGDTGVTDGDKGDITEGNLFGKDLPASL